MLPYTKALKRHRTLLAAATHAVGMVGNDDAVSALWLGASGADAPRGSYGEAAGDVYPVELAGVLGDDTAVAYAVSCLLRGYAEKFGVPVNDDAAADVAAALATGKHSGSALRDAARAGWALFAERVEKAGNIATGLGWDLSASLPHIAKIPDRSAELRMLKRIADLAGRMFKSLRGAKSKRSPKQAGEYHGVETGDAIQRMTGSQMAALADDVSEILVWEAFTRRQLQQFATRGPAKEGRGPLVVAIDESGSMDGDRNEWAKAAAMALTRSAHTDGRPVAILHWSTGTRVRVLKPGDIEGQIAAMLHFYNGGTDTVLALGEAHRQVEALRELGHKGADVVFVTDGEDPRRSEIEGAVERLTQDGTRLWTVGIDLVMPESNPLRSKATKYIPLDRRAMTDPTSLNAIVGAL